MVSLPSGPGSIEGLGDSFEPRLNTGTAAYRVAIAVPPGVNGHAPELALEYDSGAGNGHFGIGWQLPVPAIYRKFDKGQPAYADGDTLVYAADGEELVPLADGFWRCENETDFVRFERIGDGWEARDRSGRIYRLGTFPNGADPGRVSRVVNPEATQRGVFEQTFRWYVDSFEDTNGNRIEYFYDQLPGSSGQLYLREVQYGRNGANVHAVSVEYETRGDAFTDYRPGFAVRTGHRATRIRVASRGQQAREYRLSYEDTADEIGDPQGEGALPLGLSLLTKVVQYDRGGASFLPPLRFGYTALRLPARAEVRSMADAPLDVVGKLIAGQADLLDVNGDGLPDVLDTSAATHRYHANRGGDRFGPSTVIGIEGAPGAVTGGALGNDAAVLADVDGDGLADLVRAPGDTVFRNRGDGSWAAGTAFRNRPGTGIAGPDVRLLDVNFDKATDIVRSISGDAWQICENPNDNGGTWDCRIEAMPFPSFVTFDNPAVQLADMNGDRIQDVVWLRPSGSFGREVSFWPGKGLGPARPIEKRRLRFGDAVLMTAGASPVIDVGAGILDDNLRLTDLNGDGLSDLVAVGNGFVRFWINLGGERWSRRFERSGTPEIGAATALRFADMNGNGSTDLVWIRAAGSGAGWRYLDLMPEAKASQLRLIDNGLGRRITIEYGSTTAQMLAAAAEGRPWRLVAPFPVEVVRRVVTEPSLDLDAVPGPDRYVTDFVYRDAYYDGFEKEFRGFAFVKKIERGDPACDLDPEGEACGAPTLVSRTWFHTGAPDGIDNNCEPDDPSQGRPCTSGTDERTAKGGAEEEPLKGRVRKQEIGTAQAGADSNVHDDLPAPNAALFSRVENQWFVRLLHAPDGGRRGIATRDERRVGFAVNRRIDTELIERGGSAPVRVRVDQAYDDFGNLTGDGQHGDVAATGDERFTTTTYAVNQQRWILDRPAERTVRGSSDAGAAIVSQSRFRYDGPDYVGLPAGQVEKGNLSREEAYVRPGEYVPVTRKKYDAAGNVVGIMDANGNPSAAAGQAGHLTELAYDPVFRTYPIRETIHVGGDKPALVMAAEYDTGFGVMTRSVDFNGHPTDYGYDSFGRLTGIAKPGDAPTSPTLAFSYHMADPFRGVVFDYDRAGNQATRFDLTPSYVVTRQREVSGGAGTVDSAQFVDGLGRKLGTVAEAETGYVATGIVRFNRRGGAQHTYQPFPAGSLAWNLAAAHHFTTQRHDARGREIERIHPPERAECAPADRGCRTSVRTRHLPLRRTVLDENGNEMTYLTDGLPPLDEEKERLVEVQEVNRGERYVTRYQYNPADSLTRITDAQGNVKRFAYDGLQRKVLLDDPNRGVMTYAYDPASNLIATVDAKGQRITYAYDGVNRVTAEDYHDAAGRSPDVEYHYDAPVGSIDAGDGGAGRTAANTRGFLAWVRDLSGEEHTSYDRRGRAEWVVKRIPDPLTGALVSYTTEMTYDAMDRVVDLVYPDSDRLRHEYNPRGLLEAIAGGPSGHLVTAVDYAPSGQRARIAYGNGVVTEHAYDPRLRLSRLHTASGPAGGGADLLHYRYAFDGASNITRIDDQRPAGVLPPGDPRRNTQIFSYDDLYRLTRVQYSFALPGAGDRADGFIAYSYDRLGNMLSQTSDIEQVERGRSVTHHGAMLYGGAGGRQNRDGRAAGDPPGPHALTATHGGANAFAYDDNGNMTGLDGMALSWDFKDRLVAVENDEMRADYAYDYTDRRVAKRVRKKGAGAAGPERDTHVLYIDKYFEVREHDRAVKYAWMDDTRVAEMEATLDAAVQRVQRLRLARGWNLVSLAVAPSQANPFGVGGACVDAAYRWRTGASGYEPISTATAVAAGEVFWLHANCAATLAVRGTYAPPDRAVVPAGGSIVAQRWLAPLSIDGLFDRAALWQFDPLALPSPRWAFHMPSLPVDAGIARQLPPGGAIFVRSGESYDLAPAPREESVRFYHQDHLGSSNVLTDGAGAFVSQTAFHPFGHPRAEARSAAARFDPTYQFTQKERDRETDLQYFEARYYLSHTGRFVSVDPVQLHGVEIRTFPQRIGAYGYGASRPTALSDPTGEIIIPILAAVGAVSLASALLSPNVANAPGTNDKLVESRSDFDRGVDIVGSLVGGSTKIAKEALNHVRHGDKVIRVVQKLSSTISEKAKVVVQSGVRPLARSLTEAGDVVTKSWNRSVGQNIVRPIGKYTKESTQAILNDMSDRAIDSAVSRLDPSSDQERATGIDSGKSREETE